MGKWHCALGYMGSRKWVRIYGETRARDDGCTGVESLLALMTTIYAHPRSLVNIIGIERREVHE